ncbi:MAG: lecithin retinol acyltransferase family protein [Planctomycetota bacterium]
MARGDHLFVYCGGYSHHGIDLGNGEVIHFDATPVRKVLTTGPDKPCIRKTDVTTFASGRPTYIRTYHLCDDAETVVLRAESRLGDTGYTLFDNNCEHFAVWCKTGSSESTQVDSVVDAMQPFARGAAVGAVIARSARFLPRSARPWAYGAAFAISAGSFALRYASNRFSNEARGES